MFRHLSTLVLLFFLSFFLLNQLSHAKRFGGGRSFGISRAISSPTFGKYTSHLNQSVKQPLSTNRWLPMLAGFAAGGLLSYFLMGHGLQSGIWAWLFLGGSLVLVYQLFKSRKPVFSAPHTMEYNRQEKNDLPNIILPNGSPSFNETDFLRIAKTHYLRLQTAYDQKDLNDLREFTTPEVFAEIQLQLSERREVQNITEVVSLEAKILDAATEFQVFLVSVEFKALLKEEINNAPALVAEIWHFRQNSLNHWVVAGLQQI